MYSENSGFIFYASSPRFLIQPNWFDFFGQYFEQFLYSLDQLQRQAVQP